MRAFLVLLPVLAAACGDAAPIASAPLRITADTGKVRLGAAFPLTVVRTWRKGATPEPWNDGDLAPLMVQLETTARREDDRRVEETRRYRAYAFTLANVTEPLELKVERALDPAQPGTAELPEPPPVPFPWFWSMLGAVALAVGFLLLRRPRPTPEIASPEPPATPAPGPHVRALERLSRLRDVQPQDHAEFQSYYVEASALVREYVGERFDLRALHMTTEQLAAAVPRVADVLRPCDRVKFARHRPAPPERERWLERAEQFVRETA